MKLDRKAILAIFFVLAFLILCASDYVEIRRLDYKMDLIVASILTLILDQWLKT